nr:histidinol-phosphatase HisJ [Bacilli bacterium]
MQNKASVLKWDGHTHTPFCRHGVHAPFESYLQKAIELGFTTYSITEHPPLPKAWLQNQDVMDSLAMPTEELHAYLDEAIAMKHQFAEKLDVKIGLELDYLEKKTGFTKGLIESCDGKLEEVILSVHFLKGKGGMRCLDLSPEDFQDGLLRYYGTNQKLLDAYFDAVEQAIDQARTFTIPTRIGHLLLIKKFAKTMPTFDEEQMRERIQRLLPQLEHAAIGLDVNVAGLRMGHCQEVYVPQWVIQEAQRRGIALVYGSDAHRPEDVGVDYAVYEAMMREGGSHDLSC